MMMLRADREPGLIGRPARRTLRARAHEPEEYGVAVAAIREIGEISGVPQLDSVERRECPEIRSRAVAVVIDALDAHRRDGRATYRPEMEQVAGPSGRSPWRPGADATLDRLSPIQQHPQPRLVEDRDMLAPELRNVAHDNKLRSFAVRHKACNAQPSNGLGVRDAFGVRQ